MGANGSRGPQPYDQRKASTLFLRVPLADWPNVRGGFKTEFRGQPGAISGLKFAEPPTPVVAYSYSRSRGYDAALMVLEDRYQEPLLAISPEALAREGFPDIASYRSYMVKREGKRFNPNSEVTAYRVRPWKPEDSRTFADRLLQRLYGDFLPDPLPT